MPELIRGGREHGDDGRRQALGVVVAVVWSGVVSFVALMIVKAVIGLRVSEEEEAAGLDTSLHGEALEAI